MDFKALWENRYSQPGYAYGKEANEFFKSCLHTYQLRGHILLPAEGEGRNAVFAAKAGLEVTAFDTSEAARVKALQLAKEQEVEISYHVGGLEALHFPDNTFDCVGLIFAHFPPPLRVPYHEQLAKLLKTGGKVILEAFSKKQLAYNSVNPSSGGPKNIDMLFSEDEIRQEFAGFHILELREEEVELNEGAYHKGKASVIRFVGEKKSMVQDA
jgi:cyclopropane fatty-acyl-phospholipid synthase-like methyltransferase